MMPELTIPFEDADYVYPTKDILQLADGRWRITRHGSLEYWIVLPTRELAEVVLKAMEDVADYIYGCS